MGRNPVVGRQGPVHHAAVIPSEKQAITKSLKNLLCHFAHSFMIFGHQDGFGASSDWGIVHMV